MLEEDKIFEALDEQFRTALADASEEVPAGVWDAVSAGLARKKKVVPLLLWARRAGIAAAAAAAIASVLIFTQRPQVEGISTIAPSSAAPVLADAIADAPALEDLLSQTPVALKAHAAMTQRPASERAEQQSPTVQDAAEQTVPAQSEPAQSATATDGQAQKQQESSSRPAPYSSNLSYRSIDKKKSEKASVNFSSNMLNTEDSRFVRKKIFAALPLPDVFPQESAIYEKGESHYNMPLSFGVSVRYPLSEKIAIGSGLEANLLTRSFTGTFYDVDKLTRLDGEVDHSMVYIGVPVNIFYTFLSNDRFSLYTYGGGEAEIGVSNRYHIKGSNASADWNDKISGVQLSAGAGLGISMNCTRNTSIYLDPGLKYYFDCKQPRSIRTDKKLLVNVQFGLRFDI